MVSSRLSRNKRRQRSPPTCKKVKDLPKCPNSFDGPLIATINFSRFNGISQDAVSASLTLAFLGGAQWFAVGAGSMTVGGMPFACSVSCLINWTFVGCRYNIVASYTGPFIFTQGTCDQILVADRHSPPHLATGTMTTTDMQGTGEVTADG